MSDFDALPQSGDAPVPGRSELMRMATGHLARYAASRQRLRQVLERRLRRRWFSQGLAPPSGSALSEALDDVLAHLETLGLVDDGLVATSRIRSLTRKGLPERRIRADLHAAGLQADALDDGDIVMDETKQAVRYATRKKLGPFRVRDRAAFRDKDLRSLLRAGFSFSVAAATVDGAVDDAAS